MNARSRREFMGLTAGTLAAAVGSQWLGRSMAYRSVLGAGVRAAAGSDFSPDRLRR